MSRTVDNIKYTWKHKIAYLKIEKMLYGRNTIGGYLHDTDKLFMYLIFPDKLTQKIHRFISPHHKEYLGMNGAKTSFRQMLIDCECARFTKPDKPMDAKETIYMYYSDMIDVKFYHNKYLLAHHILLTDINSKALEQYWNETKNKEMN